MPLATDPPVQRAYRAACPQCGAPVDFQSAASAFAVCGYCRSTLARDGDALRRIGQSADLFDDHSPLQLGVRGRWQKEAFSLVGRLQYRYRDGTWNEWHALFDSGRSAWLSEDNGRYVMVFPVDDMGPLPPAASLPMESRVLLGGQGWLVASVQRVGLLAMQGELPQAPSADSADFVLAELRNTQGEVLSLDYSRPTTPQAALGQTVRLNELALTGLRVTTEGGEGGPAEKTLQAHGLNCPNCGAGLTIQLGTTQAIVCGQCQAVVDVSQSLDGALSHYLQDRLPSPRIPLGKVGTLALGGEPLPWQVVGYVERRETGDDEPSSWQEYLLYHRTEGFAFLVDAEEGWSWVAPITGVPELAGDTARWQGTLYRHRWTYGARVLAVLGEFYWRVQRGETTQNSDYASPGPERLNRERAGQGQGSDEVVWSAGKTLADSVVASAFGLPVQAVQSAPAARPGSMGLVFKVLIVLFILFVLLVLLSECSRSGNVPSAGSGSGYSGGSYGSSGGSYGGYSSGGSHK